MVKDKPKRFPRFDYKRNLLFIFVFLMLIESYLAVTLKLSVLLVGGGQGKPVSFSGRVGISSDGNIYDEDDIGAAPFSIAILKAAGATFVHHDYNNHIGCSNWKADEMILSVEGAATRFFGNTTMVFNDLIELDAAVLNIGYQINISTATDRFYLCAGGPMETVWRGIIASDPAKRQYCTIISHSSWNEQHTSCECSHTWNDVKNTGVVTVDIRDQNTGLNTIFGWKWMKRDSNPDINWLYSRMNFKFGDVSDCGMTYYVVTSLGDEYGNPSKLQSLLNQL
jgi:hypothetical protein